MSEKKKSLMLRRQVILPFPCLRPNCNITCSTLAALDKHIKNHFTDPAEVDYGIRPLNSLDAVYKTAGEGSEDGKHHTVADPEGTSTPSVHGLLLDRPICGICKLTFNRLTNLERYAKKHDPNMRVYHCDVVGCDDRGSYRKDKRDAHVKAALGPEWWTGLRGWAGELGRKWRRGRVVLVEGEDLGMF